MAAYQIVLIKPEGFEFVEGFRETMEAMQWGLQELGYRAPIHVNHIEQGLVPIIFGSHHFDPQSAAQLPPETILYNLEQLLPGYPWYQPSYLEVLKKFRVWDGDLHSALWLRNAGISPKAIYVPIPYAPLLERIERNKNPDIDVLFYGIQTERRLHILRTLGDSGLRVVALNNVWAKERDAWIARTQLVLGIHQRAGGRLEVARLIYLLANGVPVVSEADPHSINPMFSGAFVPAHYDDLITSCHIVARNGGLRTHLSEAGRRVVHNPELDARRILAAALSACEQT
ncbi:hypothetical protein MASR1M60_25340 [Rhodocyclaceae bacterium]